MISRQSTICLLPLFYHLATCAFPFDFAGEADPDMTRDPVQLIESRGFKAETHYVTTKDGYILTVNRIVNPEIEMRADRVVIVQHGLLGSARNWLLTSPFGHLKPKETRDICDDNLNELPVGDNLGYELSKRGFDVWLPNIRGSFYSINHTTMDTSSRKYWRFSFDEQIEFDLPAYIDYIRNQTGAQTVAYIGHSEGGLEGLGLQATKKEYNDIIKPYIGMAPVYALHGFSAFMGMVHFLPSNLLTMLTTVGGPVPRFFASDGKKTNCHGFIAKICDFASQLVVGYNSALHNLSRMHVYMASPTMTSLWNIAHYLQLILYNEPRVDKLDLGLIWNMWYYGKAHPPYYHMDRITNKYLAIMYAKNDWLVSPKSFALLKSHLKVPLFDEYRVPHNKWNHQDYIYGMEAGKYVYSKAIEVLRRVLCSSDTTGTTETSSTLPASESPVKDSSKDSQEQSYEKTDS